MDVTLGKGAEHLPLKLSSLRKYTKFSIQKVGHGGSGGTCQGSLHCPQHILLFSLSTTEVNIKVCEQKIIFQTSELIFSFVAEHG